MSYCFGGCPERFDGFGRSRGQYLAAYQKPVILVANKADTNEWIYSAAEFYALGLGDPYCISAATGSGTGELLDLIVSKFPKTTDDETDENIPRLPLSGDRMQASPA